MSDYMRPTETPVSIAPTAFLRRSAHFSNMSEKRLEEWRFDAKPIQLSTTRFHGERDQFVRLVNTVLLSVPFQSSIHVALRKSAEGF